jgi:hypothetical protein
LFILITPLATRAGAQSEQKEAPARIKNPDSNAIELPWSRPDATRPASPVSSMRELLALYGITEDDLAQMRDDGILVSDEEHLLLRILFRLGRLPPHEYAAWSQTSPDWDEVLEQPAAARANVFRLQGRVTKVEKKDVPTERSTSLGFSEFYGVTLQLEGGQAAIVFARHIPSAWLDERVRETPARADAVLLEAGTNADGRPQFVFAAAHMAWSPDHVYPQHGVSAAHLLLAQQGVDMGLFENVRATNGQDFMPADRELFYQILEAASQSDTGTLPSEVYSRLNVPQLLTNPRAFQGVPYKFVAQARRVSKIVVDDPDIQQLYGLDHYFELDVLLPLDDRPVRLQGQGADTGPLYENNYPATFCTTQLPPRLAELAAERTPEQNQRGMINEHLELSGYFFKVWAYKSEYVSSFDPHQNHLSPLFIGSSVKLAPSPPLRGRERITLLFAVAFVAAMAIIGWTAWRSRKHRHHAPRGPAILPRQKSLGG